MATIKPFRATRYTQTTEQVVAPPYDVISSDQRAKLVNQSEHNIVRLTLPDGGADRYENASKILHAWLESGILTQDPQPALYRYTQQFRNPLDGQEITRTGYFVLLRTEPYESGVVLPHEHTFPGIKEDRFKLVEATRTHLETIFGLYDPSPGLMAAMQLIRFEPVAEIKGENLPEGHQHTLERCDDPYAIERIVSAFHDLKIWIADGHHRYETALRFGQQYGTSAFSPERFIPILLVPLSDPGLLILPTHRLLKHAPTGTPDQWKASLNATNFEVQPSSPERILQELNGETVGFVFSDGVWRIRAQDYEAPSEGEPEALKRFDAYWLHKHLLPVLGYQEPEMTYTRDANEVFVKVGSGEQGAGFLLSPPTLETLQQIAAAGGKMPHKSTYFYPKVLSGMVTWQIGH